MLQQIGRQVKKPLYGQLIIGPPGSGKTTYCHNAEKFYNELGRKTCVVNLDPGNENMDYTPAVDVMKLITVEETMDLLHLGPNGALMYCAEYLEKNFDNWLLPELEKYIATTNYFIFDCPGQVELYTHDSSMAKIFNGLQEKGYYLATVNLVDSHYCSEATKFVSTLLLSLNMMLRLGLPHVNVLSKADLLKENESKLKFGIEFYTEVLNLRFLLDTLEDTPAMKKYHKLNEAICSMVEDYSLVSYYLLNSQSKESMLTLRNAIDKANGYVYKAGEEQHVNSLMSCAEGAESQTKRQTKYIDAYM
ncbi:GPN-loop GTPase 2 [Teleopsis dalmanni]|uniref:GPN-loop GTPase 2 n=1 Tax=Teleopsis dalmanni TaxID=139649 RepID=UPI0018CCA150|nr:GPN-loop GTPase 2 [Teleopsis dalmanni]